MYSKITNSRVLSVMGRCTVAAVRTEGTLQSWDVVAIAEITIAVLVCTKLRVILFGSECERSPDPSTPDPFGSQQLFIFTARGALAQEGPE